ncbi:DNA-protecting protein DprA, partial [SAR116 cluster bacterium]|nr:DNA-protecting protein DprA [SAR116 cluster bacterium]
LLKQQALSFCGSRKASEKALEAAGKCATEAVKNNIGTISGNAAGVDLTVHSATLEAGGWSIFVLPEGIKHFRIKKALSDIWDWDRCLVISPYEPDDRWQVWRAMDRNELIIALGIAMIVVEAGETGGTREAARQALKIGKPLFALSYRDSLPGNEAILRDGAKKLGISNVTGKPNIKKVISNVGHETPQSEPEKQVMLL